MNAVTCTDRSRGPKRKQPVKIVTAYCQELLTAKFPPMTNEPIRIITAFGSQWNSVCTILDKHWGILTNSPDLAKIVRTSPLLVAQRARSLVDMLIQSEFVKKPDVTWLADYPRAVGMFPCNRCQICP